MESVIEIGKEKHKKSLRGLLGAWDVYCRMKVLQVTRCVGSACEAFHL